MYDVFVCNQYNEMISFLFENLHDALTCFNVSKRDKTVVYASVTSYTLLPNNRFGDSETLKVYERE